MVTTRRLASLILVLPTLLAGAAMAQSRAASGQDEIHQAQFADAVGLFRAQRYPQAYGRFIELAERGHAPSAQMALMMYSNGPTVFGSDWDANTDQLRRWQRLTLVASSMPRDDGTARR
jgi:TPR repeat protein